MVKQPIVWIEEIGTKAFQDLWIMRRQECTQLDAYMATPTADILEQELAHIPKTLRYKPWAIPDLTRLSLS
jgi:hypothetical protein